MKVFPIRKNKIVVCSYYGMDYGDNPKAIVEELIKMQSKDELDIVWILNKECYKLNSLPQGIRKVKYESIRCLYELVTAKVWIDNSRKKFVPIKRKKQYYIQTWHAGIALKKVEKDALESLPKLYIKRAIKDSQNADLFLSNSKWETDVYKESFWYNNKILEEGLPRNDILINNTSHSKIRDKVYSNLKIESDKHIVLYAPTFRKNFGFDSYLINYKSIIKELNNKTGEQWIFLIRLHPNIAKDSTGLSIPNGVIDVSMYPDLYELMISTDCLITDYSSLMFEYSYLKKPVFIYATDIDEYNSDRGFMFDLNKLPFSISKNNLDLIRNISKFNSKEYIKKLSKFYKEIGLNETGKSAYYVAKLIMKECEKYEEK